ncbi:cryptococcal mannosyltransferase 1-domain-containing protein [Dichotomocladium elegans]|nr:cryptococcal mannosyltransferase 1-domain-containing protein [Dichotomocladium elegans]
MIPSLLLTRKGKRYLVFAIVFLFTLLLLKNHLTFTTGAISEEEEYRPSLFIAANFHNNEPILEHWIQQIDALIAWAGPSRIYVSVYESGSTDRTKAMLVAWEDRLTDGKVRHRIMLDEPLRAPEEGGGNLRRIVRLAEYRNRALDPIRRTLPGEFDRLLFLNDIYFDISDVIRLIQTNNGIYDAACGLDFFGEFYDTFATREVDGGWVGSGNYPYFTDPESRRLLIRGEPVPVYSCWNGAAVLPAKPFAEGRVSFRAVLPDEADPPLDASECCLLFSDMRPLNYTRTLINPHVKVGYDAFHYWYANTILPLWQPFLRLFNEPKRELTNSQEAEWTYRAHKIFDMNLDPEDYPCLWPNHEGL